MPKFEDVAQTMLTLSDVQIALQMEDELTDTNLLKGMAMRVLLLSPSQIRQTEDIDD